MGQKVGLDVRSHFSASNLSIHKQNDAISCRQLQCIPESHYRQDVIINIYYYMLLYRMLMEYNAIINLFTHYTHVIG